MKSNDFYKSKAAKITGTSFHEVYRKAFLLYKELKSKTKRRPYIRSAYFKKEKVFLELFWIHLKEKNNLQDKTRRLKFFACATDLIRNSKVKPTIKKNPNRLSENLYRFNGLSKDNEVFYVQIKEGSKSKQKWLISVFPDKK